MDPTWIAITVGVLLGISLAINVVLWKNLLPFPDRGSFIYTCENTTDRYVLVKVLKMFDHYNKKPKFEANETDNSVLRGIYASGLILNVVDKNLLERMGKPAGGFAIPHKNPRDAALRAAAVLRHYGYKAEISEPLENGKVFLLMTNVYLAGVLIFRKPIHEMGMPPKWDMAAYEREFANFERSMESNSGIQPLIGKPTDL